MPNITLREVNGQLTAYIAKKDLEANVLSLEFSEENKWGGKVTLNGGQCFYFSPMSLIPTLPITIRMSRG